MGRGVPFKSLLGHEPPSLRAQTRGLTALQKNIALILSYAIFLVRARFLQTILHVFVTEVLAGFLSQRPALVRNMALSSNESSWPLAAITHKPC